MNTLHSLIKWLIQRSLLAFITRSNCGTVFGNQSLQNGSIKMRERNRTKIKHFKYRFHAVKTNEPILQEVFNNEFTSDI